MPGIIFVQRQAIGDRLCTPGRLRLVVKRLDQQAVSCGCKLTWLAAARVKRVASLLTTWELLNCEMAQWSYTGPKHYLTCKQLRKPDPFQVIFVYKNPFRMTVHRFLIPTMPRNGAVELPPAEAHHATRVLRCSKDDAIVLFDGLGNEALATIESIDKRNVVVKIDSYVFAPRDHSGRLHFAVSIPKGDRQRNTIEKLVELGADSLSPLVTTRSVALVNEANIERLERYVVEACKQCGRNRLMSIRPALNLNDIEPYAKSLAESSVPAAVWILHPKIEGQTIHTIHQANALPQAKQKLLFLIGPEGGFTDEEVVLAVRQGARILSLGDRIQRVETATATAAVLGHCWIGPCDQ